MIFCNVSSKIIQNLIFFFKCKDFALVKGAYTEVYPINIELVKKIL